MVDYTTDAIAVGLAGKLAAIMAPTGPIQRVLGSLEAQVAALASTVANLTTRWEVQDEKAVEGRRLMHEKIDACREDVNKMRGEVGQLSYECADMNGRLATVETWKQSQHDAANVEKGRQITLKEIGAKRIAIIGVIGTAVGGVLINYLLKDALPRIANMLGL